MKRLLSLAAYLVVSLAGLTLYATPIQFAENGHYYEYIEDLSLVPDLRYWDRARNQALSRNFMGMPGYLATVTSIEENDFIGSLIPTNQFGGLEKAWIGGSDEQAEGTWVWADGPEAGEVFWTGGQFGSSPSFANWFRSGPIAPDDAFGEDFLTISSSRFGWQWNDVGNFNTGRATGYIVEYSPVPEPSTTILCLASIAMFMTWSCNLRNSRR